MFSFLRPRYIIEGRAVYKNASKILAYKRDLLQPKDVAALEGQLAELRQALENKDRDGVDRLTREIDRQYVKHFPPRKDAAWRENCEVLLVAIVVAVGFRTYFLQPFTIPTGSMQPTLNGIIGVPTNEPPPNIVKQVIDFAVFGRNYVNVIAKEDDMILQMTEQKRFRFFTFTKLHCSKRTYTVYAPSATLMNHFHVAPGTSIRAGEPIVRGHVTAGDSVFVDKVTYNFAKPERGDVFVFKTTNIGKIEDSIARQGLEGSQFYIKRLAGLPGDLLQIRPPELLVNSARVQGAEFERVMSAENGYRGYSNGPMGAYFDILGSETSSYRVPPESYFALGDNSYASSDSRDWGSVPEMNVMGRGFFVYWPFGTHWGLIR